MKYNLISGNLTFCFDDCSGFVELLYKETAMRLNEKAGLFRLFLDDGLYREQTVFAYEQKVERVESTQNGLAIFYNGLHTSDGRNFNVSIVAYVEREDDKLLFYADVINDDENVRVNEIQYPYFSFSTLFDEEKVHDELFVPDGLGRRIKNPWNFARDNCHTEYMSADYNQIGYQRPYLMTYPFPSSMSWYGVQSNGKFLYLGRQDELLRTCALNLYNSPRHVEDALILSVSQYPAAVKGENITVGKTHLAIFENGWRDASDYYRAWAEKEWYTPSKKPEWVKRLSGWQRIILRHQYGEIFFTYDDLFRVWQDCKKVGLNGLLIFAWWQGGMDNRYPVYKPDDALGGTEKLKQAIADIQADGGRVLLYSNGVLIDTATEYYKTIGQKISRKDIDGNEYREFYKFSNDGTLLDGFGYKTFTSACQATDEWQNHLIDIGKYKLSFHPDCIFFDQVGGHLPKPCFDKTHKHGNRIDSEAIYRCENLSKVQALVKGEQVVGTENTVDCFSPYFQFHHGHMTGAWYSEDAFPQMFRQTFPEEIVSNRLLHDDRADMFEQLAYAFINGLIFDVSIFRGRKRILGELPQYAAALQNILRLKEEYKRFFYNGTYRLTENYHLPANVFLGEYHSDSDEIGFAVWNNTDVETSLSLKGKNIKIPAKSVDFFVV